MSTVGHKAIEGGQVPKTLFLLAAMPGFPLDGHRWPLRYGFQRRGLGPGAGEDMPARPDSLCMSHPSGHMDGQGQGRAARCTETFAGNAEAGSFPLTLILRR